MSMISAHDIVRVLQRYGTRYRWLDVFSHQVRELNGSADLQFYTVGDDQYRVNVDGQQLDVRMYRDKGVSRWSLGADQQGASGAAITGAALGALVGVAARTKGPEGLILGLLLGGLAGAAPGSMAEQPNENRIMTLRYEPSTGSWNVYHGAYVQWAKEALRPG